MWGPNFSLIPLPGPAASWNTHPKLGMGYGRTDAVKVNFISELGQALAPTCLTGLDVAVKALWMR